MRDWLKSLEKLEKRIVSGEKLDIVRFIMERFPSFSTEIEFLLRITLFEIYIEKPHNFKISLNIMKIYGKQLKNYPRKWYNSRKIL